MKSFLISLHLFFKLRTFHIYETLSCVLQFGSTLVTYLIVLLQLKFSVAGTSHWLQNTGSATQNASAVMTRNGTAKPPEVSNLVSTKLLRYQFVQFKQNSEPNFTDSVCFKTVKYSETSETSPTHHQLPCFVFSKPPLKRHT